MEQLAKRAVVRRDSLPSFECYDLGDGHRLQTGQLPLELRLDAVQFQNLWRMRPSEFDEIMMHGRLVPTPRWQQAYGKDYHYSGQVNEALPTPAIVEPLIAWAKAQIDDRLNAILVNWYDGKLSHYIGRHRDNRANMLPGAPIVTISFGEERIFRLRPWPSTRQGGVMDFPARDGTVFVMPFETNLAWTHEVPASKKQRGRRISVTLRAFK